MEYVSWTGCVPQVGFTPSTAFLHSLRVIIDEGASRRNRQEVDYNINTYGKRVKKMAKEKKDWIRQAMGKKGALHKELGVPLGEKIPAAKLAKAAKAGGTEGKRARLAETLKGFKK